MPHMTTYGDQMDQKWTGSAIKPSVCPSRSGPEVSVCLSVRPKHFPYLLDEHHARELQAQGACALRFLDHIRSKVPFFTNAMFIKTTQNNAEITNFDCEIVLLLDPIRRWLCNKNPELSF